MLKRAILLLIVAATCVNSQLGLSLLGGNNKKKNETPSGVSLSISDLTSILGNGDNNEKKPCEKSESTFDGGKPVCKNSIIFQDNFEEVVNESNWIVEQYIPTYSGEGGQNYEFVYYRNSPTNVYVSNKALHIKPVPINDLSKLRGTLDLTDGCTSRITSACNYRAMAGFILPPISSGKIRTKSSFKYGRIDIEAKLPRGNWIYPTINLGSSTNPNVSIVIAYARGNDYLTSPEDDTDIGSRTLYGGAVVHPLEPARSKEWKSFQAEKPFNSEKRLFSTIWQPGKIISYVDGIEYATTYTKNYAELNNLEFHLTLGVAVGGINDFPDNYVSNGKTKPWMNKSRKNLREFVDSMNDWLDTWSNEQATLKVYSVKVSSL